jgi:GDP-L-fucose synthase
MKVFITGGTGFLGKHLIPKLKNHNVEVWAPNSQSINLTDRDKTVYAIKAFRPDVILHMAAICGGILANKNSPADFLHKNIDMGSNIFAAANHFGCKKVYTLGSVCSYPKFCPSPFKEENIWEGYPEETNAPYGFAKRFLLMLNKTYREQYGFTGAHLIPVNMYGEHDHFDLVNSHVIPALIRKFINAKDYDLSYVECWGTGEATREFMYAGDCSDAIIKAIMNNLDTDLPINLGMGKDISIKNLAFLIKELTQFEGEIVFNGQVSDGQPKRLLDVSRAKELLDWSATTSLKEGLIKTINWYQENKSEINK